MTAFAAYLARLECLSPLTQIATAGACPSAAPPPEPDQASLTLTSTSPAKRPRSDSPDTSTASSPPSELADYFVSAHAARAARSPAAPTSCALRSILTSLSPSCSSSPGTSPPTSRPLSRRSSTSCSKSVRFARCTNASVFPALSGDEYDRTPIVPTCQSESLALPKRKRDEAEGWIKCVERERAAAAKRKAAGEAPLSPTTACGPWRSPSVGVPSPVEGVHGLIEGGYFVGEERDEVDPDGEQADDSDEPFGDDEVDYRGDADADVEEDDEPIESDAESDRMAVDEPALVQDDSGSDSDSPLSVGSEDVVLVQSSIEVTLVQQTLLAVKPVENLGFGFSGRSVSIAPEEEDEDARAAELERERLAALAAATAAAAAAAASKQKCRDRYGICALGKYTRAEVFQSYDSLGGF